MKKIFFILILSACSSAPKEPIISPAIQSALAASEQSFKQKDFAKAKASALEIIQSGAVGASYAKAHFILGQIAENESQWKEAIDSYSKSTLIFSQVGSHREMAQAMFRKAICHEGLGDDIKVIALLKELTDENFQLREDQRLIEVPARLAAAYARIGNSKESDKYFAVSERELARIQATKGEDRPKDWYAKLLFEMGSAVTSKSTNSSFFSFMKSLERSQKYFIRSLQTDDPTWARPSLEKIKTLYQSAIEFIEKVPLEEDPDSMIAKLKRHETQKDMAADIFKLIEKLKSERIAGDSSATEDELFLDMKKIEDSANEIYERRPPNQSPTEWAKKRESLKKEGRVIDPEGTLERLPKKKSQSPK